MNAENWRKKSIRHDWVANVHWECARNLRLTIRTNGICTTQHLSSKMTHINSYGSYWVPLSYGLVPHLSKKLSKLPQKLLWDFNILTDHLLSARRPDLIIINKKIENLQNCLLAAPADHRIKLKVRKEGYTYP